MHSAGVPTLSEALAAVGGSDMDPSATTVAVSESDVSAYAQLRACVEALIHSYEEVAAMFASSLPAGLVDPDRNLPKY
jgi:hypothetical protein